MSQSKRVLSEPVCLPVEAAVLYRVGRERRWHSGRATRLQHDEVEFRGEANVAVGKLLELTIRLPLRVAGEPTALICGRGTVARCTDALLTVRLPRMRLLRAA